MSIGGVLRDTGSNWKAGLSCGLVALALVTSLLGAWIIHSTDPLRADAANEANLESEHNSFTRSESEESPLEDYPMFANLSFSPNPAEYPAPVSMTVDIFGSSPITTTWYEISYPNGTWDSGPVEFLQGQSYNATFSMVGLGEHHVEVYARNEAGYHNATNGSFWVNDTRPPVVLGGIFHATADINVRFFYRAYTYDNHSVEGVWASITDPHGRFLGNHSMVYTPGIGFHLIINLSEFGNHSVDLWAVDSSGNWGYGFDVISVVDRVSPEFGNVTVHPVPQEVFFEVCIAVELDDNDAIEEALLILEFPDGEITPVLLFGAAPYYTLNWTYPMIGDYNFEVFARDAWGNTNTTSGGFQIIDSTPPIADAGPDIRKRFGAKVNFDASASVDNYEIESYMWTFSDDGENVTLHGPNPSYRFRTEGKHNITLTVFDASGNADTDYVIVHIESYASVYLLVVFIVLVASLSIAVVFLSIRKGLGK